jgi:NAD-dependent dihydropyrimidine dehydrogenase PreA subunit
MLIDQELCIGCGGCLVYCPVKAITMTEEIANIDYEQCVECANCLRMSECPVDAIVQPELEWPRTVRSLLSDPLTIAEESGISGRGTEEMKTNEVTGRFPLGKAGIGLEVGRPITGAYFYDIEKIAMAVAQLNVQFETINPTTSLMSDPATGKFRDDVLNERVLSAILEFSVDLQQLPKLFEILHQVSGQIESVFTVDLATKVAPDGSIPTVPFTDAAGLWVAPNGKTNVGLGKPRFEEK